MKLSEIPRNEILSVIDVDTKLEMEFLSNLPLGVETPSDGIDTEVALNLKELLNSYGDPSKINWGISTIGEYSTSGVTPLFVGLREDLEDSDILGDSVHIAILKTNYGNNKGYIIIGND